MAVRLPVLTGLLVGGSLLATQVHVAVALLVVGVVMVIALRFGDLLSRLVFSRSDEVLLLVILGLTLMVAGLAEWLQVSAAVGAFLVGLAISGPVAHGRCSSCSSACGPIRARSPRARRGGRAGAGDAPDQGRDRLVGRQEDRAITRWAGSSRRSRPRRPPGA
jgi:hypothetical protein